MKKTVSLLVLSALFLTACQSDVQSYTAYTAAMDTSATVTVYGDGKAAAEECARLFEALDAELSVTASDSLVAMLNKNGSVSASEDLASLIEKANYICDITDGAFNVCVYPLVKLWGFTTGAYRVPDGEEIAAAVDTVAASSVTVKDGFAVVGGGEVDFGGIAKGYAAEKMAQMLKERGAGAAIISLGGNIRTVGKKPNGEKWRIGINSPTGDGVIGTLSLDEAAVVTSGSYLRYFEADGKTYHHIIDPASGYPADSGLVSVTVVAEDAALADGLSTAFFVMGKEKAASLAAKLGVNAVFITEDTISLTKGLRESFTPDSSVEGVYTIKYLS